MILEPLAVPAVGENSTKNRSEFRKKKCLKCLRRLRPEPSWNRPRAQKAPKMLPDAPRAPFLAIVRDFCWILVPLLMFFNGFGLHCGPVLSSISVSFPIDFRIDFRSKPNGSSTKFPSFFIQSSLVPWPSGMRGSDLSDCTFTMTSSI